MLNDCVAAVQLNTIDTIESPNSKTRTDRIRTAPHARTHTFLCEFIVIMFGLNQLYLQYYFNITLDII